MTRDELGHLLPGSVLNPKGRPRKPIDLVVRARESTENVLTVLENILADPARRASDRMRAGEILLERGHGKAVERVQYERANSTAETFDIERLPEGEIESLRALVSRAHVEPYEDAEFKAETETSPAAPAVLEP